MSIDVIIPVYKPGKELFQLLDSLMSQKLPVHKIILMNTEQKYWDELTKDICFEEKYPIVSLHHLTKAKFDHGGTRNQGVSFSDSEIFVCMTQDAMPVDEMLTTELTKNLKGNVAVAYGRQLPASDSSDLEKASRYFNYPGKSCIKTQADLERLGIKTFFCSNVCAAYRRDIYDELGGFITHTIFNEDMIFAAGVIGAGYEISYEAQARVIHSHNYSCMQQLRRNFDLGVSQADHPEIFKAVPSESEGKKLVGETVKYLNKRGKWYKIPGFFVQCAYKYAGYLMGKNYRKLPMKWVRSITTNQAYWDQ